MDLRPEFFSVGGKGAKQQVEMAFFYGAICIQTGPKALWSLALLEAHESVWGAHLGAAKVLSQLQG